MQEAEDDPTAAGGRSADEWSLASFGVRSLASSSSEFDVRSLASSVDTAADFDVRSVSSSASYASYGVRSAASSHTAAFAESLLTDYETGSTAPHLPLSAVSSRRLMLANNADAAEIEDDRSSVSSMVSISTRRGWPRVSPLAAPASRPLLPRSYRDAVLRDPDELRQQRQRREHEQRGP